MKFIYKLKMRYYKLRNYIENCIRLYEPLSEQFITDVDDMTIKMNKAIIENAYDIFNDMDEYGISNDALEDLYIARHMIRELDAIWYGENTKDQKKGMAKRTFEFIGKNMYRWWI